MRNRLHVGLCAIEAQRALGSLVAVFADESIYLGLFTEALDSGSKDEQIASVGDGHAGAVDGLVGNPCRAGHAASRFGDRRRAGG